jgi:hypothetical protein
MPTKFGFQTFLPYRLKSRAFFNLIAKGTILLGV